MAYPLEHHEVTTNGIRLHVVQCGPARGPLVLLLHGFPEFWYAWRHQIPALADAGFRVWAPDQRGYNLSDKPRRVRDYAIDQLAADIIGLINAAGEQTAAVVGHDWGAAVAWHLAAHHPDRISRAAILNVPHPQVLSRALRRKPGQLLKSWYVFFFQLPWVPEALVRLRGWWLGRKTLRGTSRRGTFTDEDLALYRAAWAQPRAMRSMINWYRAAGRYARWLSQAGRVRVPVRIIWGEKDAFLKPELAHESLAFCDDGHLTYLRATHWVQHERAEEVNEILLDFLTSDNNTN
ncbi:alpha/beta fold hydrolase [Hymenobacter arizonensis]|uniref:Pimeloyl-ACP methyl ester carboxylesterase n=1 Tax=Hymenobacter arizonensis TaxID=1227077 RepID=A0A1I5ZUM4_HYMAR|nr:alpha/beta fold hydrolase [Hymenobacter arizonensis]SFQ60138.1 Pimeloyl-ACP methyl ester carboxylesterase [Hymenobacter arizonensis]